MDENPWQLRQHFISYRWETPQHDDWVRAFAEGLRTRGYPVILDSELMDAPGSPESSQDQLLQLFKHLVDVTHFTPIVTPGYSERVIPSDGKLRDGWVYDEWTIALKRAAEKRDLIFDGVWRAGDATHLPAPLTENTVADFRGDDLEADLDRWYPRFEVNVVGKRYNGNFRVVGPILYTEYLKVVDERFRPDAGEYSSVTVVRYNRG